MQLNGSKLVVQEGYFYLLQFMAWSLPIKIMFIAHFMIFKKTIYDDDNVIKTNCYYLVLIHLV